MNKKSVLFMLPVATMVLGISLLGCSNDNPNETTTQNTNNSDKSVQNPKSLEPVTLTLGQPGDYVSETEFMELFEIPLKKKYPHITLKLTRVTDLNKAVISGELPDLFVSDITAYPLYSSLNLFMDLSPFLKAHKFDLNRLAPTYLKFIKDYAGGDKIVGLPTAVYAAGLNYNKDIFDRFGVPYPKDGMTWDDTIALATKLSRNDGGVQYYGLSITPANIFNSIYTDLVDAKTDEVKIMNDKVLKAFNLGKQIYSIPMNGYDSANNSGSGPQFTKNRNVAMLATKSPINLIGDVPDLNWDMAQYPSFKETPNLGFLGVADVIHPLVTSKYRDDQMRVLEVYYSEEVQMVLSRKFAKVSPLANPKMREVFGKDDPILKDKNLASLLKSVDGESRPGPSIYYSFAATTIRSALVDVVSNKKDENTALRESLEKIQSYIKTEKAK